MIKRYRLSLFCAIVIWVLSLMPVPEMPLDDVPLVDKWTHLVMYGTLTLLFGIENLRGGGTVRHLWLALRVLTQPVLMGGLVEIVQATCTNGVRSGDWMDFAANAVGAVIGFAAVLIVWRLGRKGSWMGSR